MASVKLEHIYKVYPNGTKAVSDFSMDIKDGEFIVFVGPSGCGKSTTLRMIAGLEDITTGELYIDNRIVNSVEPKDRDIAMVFQNYALYPHMTIYENMAFGLKIRHVKNEIIHQKVLWAAEVLGITDYLDRKPKAMSGGQRQRVALGRAILRDPKVMLLDEPLSNLDAKLRTQMRSEIAKLHQQLKTTFIYVTHDQTEAMTLGNRVVVMKDGFVQQIDKPKSLYDYPCNKFVAGFIGTPQMNFFQGTLLREKDKVLVKFAWSDAKIYVPYEEMLKVNPAYLDGKHEVYIGVRCENISVATGKSKENTVKVKVSHFEELGAESLIYGDINMEGDGFEETSTRIIMKVSEVGDIKIGDIIDAKFDMNKAHFFDIKTEETILPRIPTENAFDCQVKGNTVSFIEYSAKLPKAIDIEDVSDGVLTIPTNAIKINAKGKFEAEVLKVENIEGTKLCYLVSNGRTFFTVVEEDYKAGEKINFDIDYTLIRITKTVKDEEVEVLKPLGAYDPFVAKYYNYNTIIHNHPDEKFVEIHNARIEEAKATAIKAREELKVQEEKEINSYTLDSISKGRAEASKNLETLNQTLAPRIAETKAQAKKELDELKAKHKAKVAEIKANVKKEYDNNKKVENETYHEFLKTNKDKLSIRRRKEEHRVFKETNPKQKERDLTNLLNSEAVEYEGEASQIKSRLHRELGECKTAVKAAKKEIAFYKNPIAGVKRKYAKLQKELDKKEKRDIRLASLLFFFNINNFYTQVSDTISNKLIQGLGTNVFTKSFVLEIPHDAYEISEDRGIPVTVVKALDYGTEKYIQCTYEDENGETINVYILTDKKLEEGAKINIVPDINKSIITEPTMNIRLY